MLVFAQIYRALPAGTSSEPVWRSGPREGRLRTGLQGMGRLGWGMRWPGRDGFLRACRLEPVHPTPVWLMRQAGRYLPQYRAVRRRLGLFDIIRRPDMCAEVTCQPVDILGVDAAILFSDISVAFAGLGVEFELHEQVGPVVPRPVRTAADVEGLKPLVPEQDVPHVAEAVRLAVSRLPVPLIGSAGGPFTLASYLIEGGPSRRFLATKRFMMRDSGLWRALMERLTDACVGLLEAQVRAGALAVQVFDSWVGALSPADFDEFIAPYVRRLFEQLRPLQVPAIYFGVETAGLLERMRATGASVLGVDWRTDLAAARKRVGNGVGQQGNLDPATC